MNTDLGKLPVLSYLRRYTSLKVALKLFLMAGTFLFLNISCSHQKDIKTIKLAHGLDINHSVHKAMVLMGEDLNRLSDGKLKLEIYPSEQLGTERQSLELLQIGSLDMTKVSAGTLENFAPKIKVLGLPFLFKDRKHSFEVLDGPIGEKLLNGMDKYWLKGLGYYDAGSRSFYTKETPVNTPNDLSGLKIRVMESVNAVNMVKALGGSPTPISWGELYTALQQGVVDGAENNPPSFYLSRHYEVCKYYSLDEHTVLPDVLLTSTHLWNSLTNEEQEWLDQAVKTSLIYQRKLWLEAEKKALAEVQKAGVTIIRPDKELFSKRTDALLEDFKNDREFYELIQQIRKTE